jgi:glycosyltransferase involved in cell wall biosynthesis
LKIAILGTRGIPNHYGGFEQCAEFLALGLVKRGYDVLVYNSHNHPFSGDNWKGVKIVHCNDPEHKWGTIGQFIYDLNCIKDARKRKFDVILQLGYSSSSVWGRWLPRKYSIITTNMDGLEWKRTKFSTPIKFFLLYAESLAVKVSDHLIADSIGIQNYLKEKYNKESTYIPYGAEIFTSADKAVLAEYQLKPNAYDMLIARLEPENSIEIILDGVVLADNHRPFLVVGKHQTKYGEYLKKKFSSQENIIFLGGIYDLSKLNNLRYYSNIYFHGHSVGGTNPSLLEAMASNCLICANDNPFNKYILNEDGIYFSNSNEVAETLLKVNKCEEKYKTKIANNGVKIRSYYSWDIIVDQYATHLDKISMQKRNLLPGSGNKIE